ncbi:hypothetical protein PpBr36_07583 [Pyricularia pennisetigena]|uniref:hypothetical protein n=1 Tax=Pyricularia pennisetigena TaxID=1578925 RepID=UPI0011511C02|nr:hypothetical protein PpBr36_07583 [Pyricularia pennisetigena]TLS25171.1 hypothetical protein PpBr36_07583 [Pyricularia pennisetigena]
MSWGEAVSVLTVLNRGIGVAGVPASSVCGGEGCTSYMTGLDETRGDTGTSSCPG